MVAVIGITAQVSPMEGLYTASAVPTINPPPTHVAETHTQKKAASETHSRMKWQNPWRGLVLMENNKMASFQILTTQRLIAGGSTPSCEVVRTGQFSTMRQNLWRKTCVLHQNHHKHHAHLQSNTIYEYSPRHSISIKHLLTYIFPYSFFLYNSKLH